MFEAGDDVMYTAPAEQGGWKTRAVVVGIGGRSVIIEYPLRGEVRVSRVRPSQLRLIDCWGVGRRAA